MGFLSYDTMICVPRKLHSLTTGWNSSKIDLKAHTLTKCLFYLGWFSLQGYSLLLTLLRVMTTLEVTPKQNQHSTVMRNDEIRRNDRKSPIDRPDYRKRYLHEPMRKLSWNRTDWLILGRTVKRGLTIIFFGLITSWRKRWPTRKEEMRKNQVFKGFKGAIQKHSFLLKWLTKKLL